jgi:hypothetical protein
MKRRQARAFGLSIAFVVTALACALSVPPARALIEQSMVWHMVVQMPMLLAAGWLWMGVVPPGRGQALEAWNRFGLTGFIAGQVVFAWWMLPVSIDRAVVMPSADLLKLVSLLACGAVLRHSVERSPAVVQLFFVGYAVTMLIATGVFLATTERRLCNAYSLDSQLNAGVGVAALGLALGAAWACRVIMRSRQASPRQESRTPQRETGQPLRS